jgi:PIN domain nuclease of toxin-antitoxin system
LIVEILLDTQIFLWLTGGNPRLKARGRDLIDSSERVFVSAATIWEISIKVGLKKLVADPELLIQEIEANGFEELPVLARHAKGVAKLPHHHGDPFDRLLIAQAISESLRLLTSDGQLAAYSELVVAV